MSYSRFLDPISVFGFEKNITNTFGVSLNTLVKPLGDNFTIGCDAFELARRHSYDPSDVKWVFHPIFSEYTQEITEDAKLFV